EFLSLTEAFLTNFRHSDLSDDLRARAGLVEGRDRGSSADVAPDVLRVMLVGHREGEGLLVAEPAGHARREPRNVLILYIEVCAARSTAQPLHGSAADEVDVEIEHVDG